MEVALCEFVFAWPSDALCEAAAFADDAAFFKFALGFAEAATFFEAALCASDFFEAVDAAAVFLETSEADAGFLGAAVFAEAATVFEAAEFFCEAEDDAFSDVADFFEAAAFTDAGFAEAAIFFEAAPGFVEAAIFFEAAFCASDFFAAFFCGFFKSDFFSSNLPREFASADFFCAAGEGANFFETDSAFLETATFADDVLRAAELLDFPPIMIFYRKKVFLARGRKCGEGESVAVRCTASEKNNRALLVYFSREISSCAASIRTNAVSCFSL